MMLFTDVLRNIRKGKTVDVATAKLAELVAKVKETGNGGTLTLKLTVKRTKGADDMVDIVPSLSTAMPSEDLAGAVFYIDADGYLTRNDPNQREMFEAAAASSKAAGNA